MVSIAIVFINKSNLGVLVYAKNLSLSMQWLTVLVRDNILVRTEYHLKFSQKNLK